MRRNIMIATVTAAVLVGGGTYTAFAVGTDDGGPSAAPVAARTAGVTQSQARAAALAVVPGTVISTDDDHTGYWEVKVLGKDQVRHELHVDVRTGKVTEVRDDRRPSATPTHRATPSPTATRGANGDRGGDRTAPDDHPGAHDRDGDRTAPDDHPGAHDRGTTAAVPGTAPRADDRGGDRTAPDDHPGAHHRRGGGDHGDDDRGPGHGGGDDSGHGGHGRSGHDS
jgi:hypothetical protein